MSLTQYGWFLDGMPTSAMAISGGGGDAALPAGKYYWEVTIDTGGSDSTDGYGIHFGVAGANLLLYGTVATAVATAVPNSQYGNFISTVLDVSGLSNAPGWGYPSKAGGLTAGCASAAGQVFACAVDTVLKRVWFKNVSRASIWGGGGGAGDPAAGTQGADFSASGGSPILTPIYAMFGASHGESANRGKGTVNFGASAFTGTVPTGFVSIESVHPSAQLNPSKNSNLTLTNNNLTYDGDLVPVSFSPAYDIFTANVGYSNSVLSRFSIAQGP